MRCKFWVGQRVVCVESFSAPNHRKLTKGRVYTVRSVVYCPFDRDVGVRIKGLINPRHPVLGMEYAYVHYFFRPATDISIFHEIVAKVKTGKRDLVPTGAVR